MSWIVVASMLTGLAGSGAGIATAVGVDVGVGMGAADSSPALAGVANLRQEVVFAGTVVNGNRVDLNRFVDERPAEALREEVRRNWLRRPAPVHSSSRDGWLVLTQVNGSSVETLEVRPYGTATQGRWWRLRKGDGGLAGSAAWMEAALPAGSRVLDRIAHEDDGRRMTTVVAATAAPAAEASAELVAMLQRNGFTIQTRSSPSFVGDGLAFFLARGAEDLAVTVSEHAGRRAMVLHWGRAAP